LKLLIFPEKPSLPKRGGVVVRNPETTTGYRMADARSDGTEIPHFETLLALSGGYGGN
jgi:hypothetical protein